MAPGIHAHSIIAVQGTGPIEDGDDGVVKYSSAHIAGVESELVIRSGHSVQGHPLAVDEVRPCACTLPGSNPHGLEKRFR